MSEMSAPPLAADKRAASLGGRRARRIEAMLRVDHAGEYAAVRLYRGQLAALRPAPGKAHAIGLLETMQAQEEVHLARFEALLRERRVRPSLLAPLWDIAGFGLGAATALISEEAAHACTAAVEEVIAAHYADQAAEIAEDEPELSALLAQYGSEELHHRETALAEGAERAPAYPLLTAVIKAGCRAAIRIAEIV